MPFLSFKQSIEKSNIFKIVDVSFTADMSWVVLILNFSQRQQLGVLPVRKMHILLKKIAVLLDASVNM